MPGDDETQRLRFHLLGPVRAERDGEPLSLGSPHQRMALAILLLRGGRTIGTAEFVDALWGDAPPQRATDTLDEYITALREQIGTHAEVLISTEDSWAARVPEGALDAAVFDDHLAAAASARAAGDMAGARERLAAGLALWEGGTALVGLPGPCAERERDRLTELRATAREDLFDCALALGRHADAVAGLRALAAEHPLRERTRALLMLALHRAGRQAEALAVFGETTRLLLEELGTEPGPELTRLHEQVPVSYTHLCIRDRRSSPPNCAPSSQGGPGRDPSSWR